MYPEEYTEEFDGTQADYDAMYNWDPITGEVKGAVMTHKEPISLEKKRI